MKTVAVVVFADLLLVTLAVVESDAFGGALPPQRPKGKRGLWEKIRHQGHSYSLSPFLINVDRLS